MAQLQNSHINNDKCKKINIDLTEKLGYNYLEEIINTCIYF